MKLFHATLISGIVLLFLACTDFNAENLPTKRKQLDVPEMEFTEPFTRVFYNGNDREWKLLASNAQFFQSRHRTIISNVELHTLEGTNISARISGLYGIINTRNNNMELFSNVVMRSSNHTTLYTSQVEWDSRTQKLHTTNEVRIIHPSGHWVDGVGMEADLGLEEIIIYNETDEGYGNVETF